MLAFWAFLLFFSSVCAHMSIWHPSMYGWDLRLNNDLFISPMLGWTFDEWWFRGLMNNSTGGAIMALPAGGTITFEIACHIAWTSYSPVPSMTTVPGSFRDACPGGAGPYHAGDPNGAIQLNMTSGCALGIADKDDITQVTKDDFVIFSTNQTCVSSKLTNFDVPALMPPCTGKKCICAWFWTASNGTANYYMTGFDCAVTNSSPNAQLIGIPSTPNYTTGSLEKCGVKPNPPVTGPKKPFYLYNDDTDTPGITNRIPWLGNFCRAGYHSLWSFPVNGAQNDIFTGQLANRIGLPSASLPSIPVSVPATIVSSSPIVVPVPPTTATSSSSLAPVLPVTSQSPLPLTTSTSPAIVIVPTTTSTTSVAIPVLPSTTSTLLPPQVTPSSSRSSSSSPAGGLLPTLPITVPTLPITIPVIIKSTSSIAIPSPIKCTKKSKNKACKSKLAAKTTKKAPKKPKSKKEAGKRYKARKAQMAGKYRHGSL